MAEEMTSVKVTDPENDAKILIRLPRALRDRVNACAAYEIKRQNTFCTEALTVWCDSSEDMRRDAEREDKPE